MNDDASTIAQEAHMRATTLTGWRRVASALWSAPRDPQIFGTIELDARPILSFIEAARAQRVHLTPTHLVGRALTKALEDVPELNVRIVGNRAYARPSIEIFFITALEFAQTDLSGVKVDVTRRDVFELATELERRVHALRDGRDQAFARSKRIMDKLPRPLLQVALRTTSYLSEQMQLDLPLFGLHRSPFGSAMISSVGSLGLSQGFAPLCWAYDVPVLLLMGQIEERPVVEKGMVVARPVLPLSVTLDHRYVDGVHISRALRSFRMYLESPTSFEPALSSPRAGAV